MSGTGVKCMYQGIACEPMYKQITQRSGKMLDRIKQPRRLGDRRKQAWQGPAVESLALSCLDLMLDEMLDLACRACSLERRTLLSVALHLRQTQHAIGSFAT